MDPSFIMWNADLNSNLQMPSSNHFPFLNDHDMGNMHFDFQADSDAHQHSHSDHLTQQEGHDVMGTHMHNESMQLEQLNTLMHDPTSTSMALSQSTLPGTPIVPGMESLGELDAQIQYLQQKRRQAQDRAMQEQRLNFYAQHSMIPPTPNSFEMHPNYYPHSDQQQPMFDSYRMRLKEQEISFTPLVSPAVTPLDAHFNIPEYTMSGASISPLSSPALHAQNGHQAVRGPKFSDTSASPIEMNIESDPPLPGLAPATGKSVRKPAAKPRGTRVRQCPIVKSQKKRTGSTAISAQVLADMIALNSQEEKPQASSTVTSSEVSENDSISPEHLSDMAPPPLPPSSKPSPYLAAQNPTNAQQGFMGDATPATPASLMMMMRTNASPSQPAQQSPKASMSAEEPGSLDDFTLPEPAKRMKPQPAPIDTRLADQARTTPESNSAKRTTFQPLPSPIFARPAPPVSAAQSPQISAMSPDGPNSARKTPQLSATRNTKKRSNTNSFQVSPALRPRISPSIKPLLPGGFSGQFSDETASLLLASKSNYQNILEGTVINGVQYPEELEKGLTSKRTSHKIAEQGRRNRMNTALQNLRDLIPARFFSKNSGAEKSDHAGAEEKGAAGGQNSSSKASTVEVAIEYITALERDLAKTTKRAEEAEMKLGGMSPERPFHDSTLAEAAN